MINVNISLLQLVKHFIKALEGPDPMISQALYEP